MKEDALSRHVTEVMSCTHDLWHRCKARFSLKVLPSGGKRLATPERRNRYENCLRSDQGRR